MSNAPAHPTRRHFISQASAAGLVAPVIITAASTARAQEKADSAETLRIGLIGCGGRGTGAAAQALKADPNSHLVAVADVFPEQIETSLASITEKFPDRVKVPEEQRFLGLDAYQKVIDSGVDVVLLASPPAFRPAHLHAAVDAGKHIFCEKPMAVDAVGYRSAVEAVVKAREKRLNLVAGFCWRYSTSRREAFDRIHNGAIGDLTGVYTTYLANPVKPMAEEQARTPEMSDVEWQLRNWYNFSWLSGDGLVEQAVHSVDKICWAMGDTPPLHSIGLGGRQIPSPGGNIFDHFHIAYDWGKGVTCHISCRQIKGCHNETIDLIRGTSGQLTIGKGGAPFIDGPKRWRFQGEETNMYDMEHNTLFKAIRKGDVVNDGDAMMLSTLVAIMGRESAYTGQRITWQQITESQQDLAPDTLKYEDSFTPLPLPQPGVTTFI